MGQAVPPANRLFHTFSGSGSDKPLEQHPPASDREQIRPVGKQDDQQRSRSRGAVDDDSKSIKAALGHGEPHYPDSGDSRFRASRRRPRVP